MIRTNITARERKHARLQIEAFCGQFGEWASAYRLLAQHAALPLILTPELVSYLRNHFLRGQVPWVAESDLLLSDLCREVAYEQYVMDQAVRAVLIEELRRDPALGRARMAEVARLLIGYIRSLARTDQPLPPHELQAQQWAAMVYLDDKRESAARQIASAFSSVPALGGVGGVERTELARLADLTQTFAPELGSYRELVSYGRNVARLLGDVTGKAAAELDRSGFLDARMQVLDVNLPLLREVVPTSRVADQVVGIPRYPELEQALAEGRVCVFAGAGLSVGAGLPDWYDLIAELAKRIEYKLPQRKWATGDALADAAQAYINQRGMYDLVRYLQDRLDTTGVQPTAAHRALARMPISLVFTSSFDDLLERAFRDAGKRVEVIVRDSSIPFMLRGSDAVNIVKLYGDLGHPTSIVLARQQYESSFLQRTEMVKLLERAMGQSTMLFLGWDHSNPHFNLVFGEQLARFGGLMQPGYMAMCDVLDAQRKELAKKKIRIVGLPAENRTQQLAGWLESLMVEPIGVKPEAHTMDSEAKPITAAAELIATVGPLAGRRWQLTDRCIVSRGEVNWLVVPDQTISVPHVALDMVDAALRIKDLRSRNGVTLDSKRLGAVFTSLTEGQTIGVGSLLLTFSKKQLQVTQGALKGKSYSLSPGMMAISRERLPVLVLGARDGAISDLHALLSLEGQTLRIKDLNSSNGTFIDGARVQEEALRPGARLKLGSSEFTFQVQFGPYTLLSLLGEGGMARVYLAEDEHQANRAVKIPNDSRPDFKQRFLRELSHHHHLQHTNIVRVHEIGEVGGRPFVAMQYIDGGTLQTRLKYGQPLPLNVALRIAREVADALEYAYSQGVLFHRDIKPSNILLDRHDRAYLTDFGIAKAFEDADITQMSDVLGTVYYMSPEQAQGSKNLDKRTDIYSLGVVLYQMLAGVVPFDTTSSKPAIMHKHVFDPPPPLREANPDVPPQVEQIILRCLAKNPDDRYQSAQALSEALAVAVHNLGNDEGSMGSRRNPDTTELFMTLTVSPGHRIDVRLRGRVELEDRSKKRLRIGEKGFALSEEQIRGQQWRTHSQQVGRELFVSLFAQHREVHDAYRMALGEVGGEKNRLHLRFVGSRDFLSVPVECCFDDKLGEPYLALRHPFSRSVVGIEPKRAPISPWVLNDLKARDLELRVLLIASDTMPPVPEVDDEVSRIASLLREEFKAKGLRTVVNQLHTGQATRDAARALLSRGEYHIVHYAGHSGFDPSSPEGSGLFFWEKPDRQGQILSITASELAQCLQNTDLRFMYLSSCDTTGTADSSVLLQNDVLEIIDGIVLAGVPAALGYRWPVPDVSAKRLAETFYRSLARTEHLDSALLEARRQVAGLNRKDATWLSPILVLQPSS